MKICCFGGGAVGGCLAAFLTRQGDADVSVIARGAHLNAMQRQGLRVEMLDETLEVKVRATDDAAELGVQDVVFITLKSHQVDGALDSIKHLLGSNTVVLPPSAGIPFWYFYGQPGYETLRLERLDPGNRQWNTIGPERVIGTVYMCAADVIGPGVVRNKGLMKFPIGEPDGTNSDRILRLAEIMANSGLDAPIDPDIRATIWMKVMMGSLCWGPISALTLATLGELAESSAIISLIRQIMTETDAVAHALGVNVPMSLSERIELTAGLPTHKHSMLVDLERGRPLELDPVADSAELMSEIAKMDVPTVNTILALMRSRARSYMTSCEDANRRASITSTR